jgi:hypothetical protein
MKPRRRAAAPLLAVLWMASGAAAPGCARHAPATPPPASIPRPAPSPPFESRMPGVRSSQARAQHQWCAYLDALYHRATQDGTSWEQLERCNAETSTAAPEMLERTAACSQQALDGFSGDPFTEVYAAQVKRCGSTVLEAMALPAGEVEPYVVTLCERVASCGGAAVEECRSDVGGRMGQRLGRALGAINAESRIALRQCLQTAACQEVTEQVAGCLEPILDHLLWTPG